jgi:HAD superfamily hydrolase (TIGR01509 family)
VFDLGGVLAYDEWEHLLLDKQCGIASINNLLHDEVLEYGKILWEEFAYTAKTDKNGWIVLEKEYWMKFKKRFQLPQPLEYFINLTEKFIRPVDGMIPIIEQLKSMGVDLAICSNNNEFWLKRLINKLNLYAFIHPEKIICSCKVGVSKSSSSYQMYHKVIRALGGDNKSSCLLMDDRRKNIERAIEFGMSGLLFPSESKIGSKYLNSLLTNMNII